MGTDVIVRTERGVMVARLQGYTARHVIDTYGAHSFPYTQKEDQVLDIGKNRLRLYLWEGYTLELTATKNLETTW
jgi:hypothetical protein